MMESSDILPAESAMRNRREANASISLEAVLAELERRGHKVTGPRRQIVALFFKQARAVTATDLYLQLRASSRGIGLVTVYRTLELLAESGLAHRLIQEDRPNHEIRYLCCRPQQGHHHHIICTHCGRTESIASCMLLPLEQEIASASGYAIERHTLELFGLCPACQASSDNSANLTGATRAGGTAGAGGPDPGALVPS
jgi:Fur family ferric uptake transcriptional regulator